MQRKGFALLIVVGILALLILGAMGYFAFRATSLHNNTGVSDIPKLDEASAMTLVYGNYNKESSSSNWTLSGKDIAESDSLSQFNPGDTVQVSYLVGAQQGERYYFMTEAASGGSHASPAILGAHILEYKDGAWGVVSSSKAFDEIGSFGELNGTSKVITLGSSQIGFELDNGYMAQGYGSETIVIYAPVGDAFHTVFTLSDAGGSTDGSEGPAVSWTSELSFIPDADYQWYDIKVQRTGTMLNNKNQVVSAGGTDLYHFVNGTYASSK